MEFAIGRLIKLAAAAGLCAALSAPVAAQFRDVYCGTPQGFDQAPEHARSGRYVNRTYGYSLTIPAGLTAYTDQSGPERDLLIVLSQAPRASLSVSAAYDVFFDITAQGVHRRDINTIRLHDALLSDQAEGAALAHVAGARYVMSLQCQGATQTTVHDEIIVLRNREIYRLELQSSPQRYEADRSLLEAMLHSWRWEIAPRY
jgi:hypothetical protein